MGIHLTAAALPIGPMAPAAVDAVLAESTAVVGWPAADVLSWRPTVTTFELTGALPPATEARHRELSLAAGASLLNLRVLIRVLGLHPAVRMLPDPDRPELLAVVRPQGIRVISSEDRLMAAGIVLGAAQGRAADSRKDRAAVTTALPDNLLGLLQRAAKVEHGWVAVIPDEPTDLRPTGSLLASAGEPVAMGLIVVIGTVLDSPVARLQAGQAMQRALLTATINGVVARPDPAALGQPAARATVRELIGGGLWPQAVLRLG
ncbi:MAG: hypothetical protein ABWZ02_10710 [Nakamurella sp.]